MITDTPTIPYGINEDCIISTAERFEIPIRLLIAILKVEGGKVGAKHFNSNGTYDIGPMQINSIWLKTFNGYVTESQLENDGCVNLQVGAWILKRGMILAGDFWKGVGNYHSKTFKLHEAYKARVYQAANNIGLDSP